MCAGVSTSWGDVELSDRVVEQGINLLKTPEDKLFLQASSYLFHLPPLLFHSATYSFFTTLLSPLSLPYLFTLCFRWGLRSRRPRFESLHLVFIQQFVHLSACIVCSADASSFLAPPCAVILHCWHWHVTLKCLESYCKNINSVYVRGKLIHGLTFTFLFSTPSPSLPSTLPSSLSAQISILWEEASVRLSMTGVISLISLLVLLPPVSSSRLLFFSRYLDHSSHCLPLSALALFSFSLSPFLLSRRSAAFTAKLGNLNADAHEISAMDLKFGLLRNS